MREGERGGGETERKRESEGGRDRDREGGGGLCGWMNRRVSEGNYSEEEVIKKENHSKKARASVARPRRLSQINPQQCKS